MFPALSLFCIPRFLKYEQHPGANSPASSLSRQKDPGMLYLAAVEHGFILLSWWLQAMNVL